MKRRSPFIAACLIVILALFTSLGKCIVEIGKLRSGYDKYDARVLAERYRPALVRLGSEATVGYETDGERRDQMLAQYFLAPVILKWRDFGEELVVGDYFGRPGASPPVIPEGYRIVARPAGGLFIYEKAR